MRIYQHHKLFLSLFTKDLTEGRYLTPVKLWEPAGQVASVQQRGHFTCHVVLAAGRVFLNTRELLFSTIFVCFFTRIHKMMWFTVSTHVDHLSGFVMTCLHNTWNIFLFFTLQKLKHQHTRKIWITWDAYMLLLSLSDILFILFTFIRVCTPQQSIFRRHFKGTLYFIYNSDLFVLQELLAQNPKWAHVGECRWCFYVRVSDRQCAGQWIYKGTSAFKNIKKETFPTQTDQ